MAPKETVPLYRKIPHPCVFSKPAEMSSAITKTELPLKILSKALTVQYHRAGCSVLGIHTDGRHRLPVFSEMHAMGYVHRYWRQGKIYPRSLYLLALCFLFPAMAPSSQDLLLPFFFLWVIWTSSCSGAFPEAGYLRHWDGENVMPGWRSRQSSSSSVKPSTQPIHPAAQPAWQPALISVPLHRERCWYPRSLVWGLRGCFHTMHEPILSTPWPSLLCF